MTEYYIGIDGGGTKTRAAILDTQGNLLGIGVGNSSNFNNIGTDRARENISCAVQVAAMEAAVPPHSFSAAFLGIAGTVSRRDRERVRDLTRPLNLASSESTAVDHDCRAALAGGLAGRAGIVQIIGTGTACFGMNAAGDRWMSGGWGHLLADEGGGYWMGVQAMKAATAATDGRGEETILSKNVMHALGIKNMNAIMQRLYGDRLSVADVAALTSLVTEAARGGDAVSIAIIARGMQEVARCVDVVAHKLGFKGSDTSLVLMGGLMNAGDIVKVPLLQSLKRRFPGYKAVSPEFPAVIGAAILARQIAHPDIDQNFIHNIKTCMEKRH